MQYQLCPRCKFRAPTNKTLCGTCGYSFVVTKKANVVAEPAPLFSNSLRQVQAAQSTIGSGGNFWRNLFGMEPAPAEAGDGRVDEPALSES